jgi:RHS repeat-associated protein
MTDGAGIQYYVPDRHPAIRVVTSPVNVPQPLTTSTGFIVRTPDGLEYDLGTTIGSRRTTIVNGQPNNYQWDLVRVVRPAANTPAGFLQQYTVSYWQDEATSGGLPYGRDATIQEIDANWTTGSAPTARTRILFNIHWPESTTTTTNGAVATTYGTNYHCAGSPPVATTLRCDDPAPQAGWEAAPLTMSTLTLDSITMQVLASDGRWHTVRQYQLGYRNDTASMLCYDPLSFQAMACAGEHLLASVQAIPYQLVSGVDTAMPSQQPLVFDYTGRNTDEYHDQTQKPDGTHEYDAQTWWQYLYLFADQQTGAEETATWNYGYGNTHGVPSGSVTDPTTCDRVNCSGVDPIDRQWMRQVVTNVLDHATNLSTTFSYQLNQPCGSGCTQDTWIPPNGWNACGDHGQPPSNPNQTCLESTWQTFYNADYTGMAEVTATHPDSSQTITTYEAGNGWGTNDRDVQVLALHLPTQTRLWQPSAPSGSVSQVTTSYPTNTPCPVVSGGNQLYNNPYTLCFLFTSSQDRQGLDPAHPSNVVDQSQTWTYNQSLGTHNHFATQLTSSTLTGNDLLAGSYANYGSTQPIFTTSYAYTWYDGSSAPYYNADLVAQTTLSDSAGIPWACGQTSYDNQAYHIGLNGALSDGLPTRTDAYAGCGNPFSGDVGTGVGYDSSGQPIVSTDADALVGGQTNHTGCTLPTGSVLVGTPQQTSGSTPFTTCATLDTTQQAYPASASNALGQTSSTSWDVLQGVPTQTTDPNQAQTSYAGPNYEYSSGGISLANYLDTEAQTSAPLESNGWSSRVYSYSYCNITAPNSNPCAETDTLRQLDGTQVAISRAFYDRDGRLVETRSSGPTPGQDVVTFAQYDEVNDKVFSSLPCSVPSFSSSRVLVENYDAPSGSNGLASAYLDPTVSGSGCSNDTGTTTYTDGSGRVVATDDPLGTGAGTNGTGCPVVGNQGQTLHHTRCVFYSNVTATAAGVSTSDGEVYAQTLVVDANLHQTASYANALGQTVYTQAFSGASQTPGGSGISSYAVSRMQYDGAGRLRVVTDPAGNLTTYTVDDLGRLQSTSDPDRGATSYQYDPNGNVLQQVDARGAAGTIYAGYDGLDRQLWRNSTNSPTGAYATFSFDSTAGGNAGIGRLTGTTFSGPAGLAGSYATVYDPRGRSTQLTELVGANPYVTQQSYTDFDAPSTTTYPDGTLATLDYNANGAPQDLQATLPGSHTSSYVVASASYNALGQLASLGVGGTPASPLYSEAFGFDGDLRLNSEQATLTGAGSAFYTLGLGYDAGGNVTSASTTLPAAGTKAGGSEQQSFCYDAFNRLVWAGTSGTPTGTSDGTCGPVPSSDTLSGASYTATFAYDNLGRMTSGPAGGYTYGDPAHLHAVTSTTDGHAYAYDAAGNVRCRDLNLGGCTGPSPTGAPYTFDNEGRLSVWANKPTGATASANELYDGAGQRVARQTTSSGVLTTSVYVGPLAEYDTSGSTTTTTDYFAFAGQPLAIHDTAWHYLVSDQLGTPEVQLKANGTPELPQLKLPYDAGRYAAASLANLGFTGQRKDTSPNLTYFNARYYDQGVGVFLSPDRVSDGANPYAYVGIQIKRVWAHLTVSATSSELDNPPWRCDGGPPGCGAAAGSRRGRPMPPPGAAR